MFKKMDAKFKLDMDRINAAEDIVEAAQRQGYSISHATLGPNHPSVYELRHIGSGRVIGRATLPPKASHWWGGNLKFEFVW